MDPGKFLDQAPDDLRYILARNEELQREKEKMQAVVEAARCEMSLHHVDCDCPLCASFEELDAKEQDDDQAD